MLERVNTLNVACHFSIQPFMSRLNCCQLHPEGSLLESGLLLSHWCDPIAYQFSFFPQRETLSCCVNVNPFYVCVNEGGLMEPHLTMKGALQAKKGSPTQTRRTHLSKAQSPQEKTCSGGQIRYLVSKIFIYKSTLPASVHLSLPPSPMQMLHVITRLCLSWHLEEILTVQAPSSSSSVAALHS